ncbi:serine O-acetyltransferase [Campylobacter sp.]|uniref:serine O-acetyltransferase n=1 Tax=Campylobacter sp. TaxID=205 RepID=UPI003FA1512F
MQEKYIPINFKDCFTMDAHELNRIPKTWFGKIYYLMMYSRYSMPVYMRLAQFFYLKRTSSKNLFTRNIFALLHSYFTRKNQINNSFEVSPSCKIERGVVFHHSGVTITSDTVIESGVHIFKNVLFGLKNNKAPYIKTGATIGSHSVILGGVIIGKNSIVAPGSVVVKDVPDSVIVAGVPAKILKKVDELS